MDEPYSQREIAGMFKAADDRADEFHNKLMEKMNTFEEDVRGSLTRIEIQVGKTNGRVDKLEKWQNWVIGFCACLSIFLVPVIIAFVLNYLHLFHG